jgi:arsenite-transporting ATPase
MVLIPEKMAILDTERAIKMFEKLDIKLSGVIVNQVYPFELLDIPNLSEFLKHRITMQKGYLREIRDKFGDLVRAIIPMFDREPKGLDMIDKVADRLFENPNLELLEMV